jgi:tetratricopeptide (TPR) repeat protein
VTKTVHKSDTSAGGIPHALLILLVLGSAVAFAADPASIDMQLEAAEHQEIVTGDLNGAMEKYQSILQQAAAPKATLAQALLHLAVCREKLGRRGEAYAAYTQLAKQFADFPEAAEARAKLADWEGSFPGPRNLRFAQGATGKAPAGWHVPGLTRDADQWAQVRRGGCHDGAACAVMLTPENAAIRAGGLDQSFKAAAYRGKTLRLRAWLRLEGGSPEDYARMYLNVDRATGPSCSAQKAEWTRCEISTRVGEDASNIDFGFMSFGGAQVWIDGVSLEIVSAAP